MTISVMNVTRSDSLNIDSPCHIPDSFCHERDMNQATEKQEHKFLFINPRFLIVSSMNLINQGVVNVVPVRRMLIHANI